MTACAMRLSHLVPMNFPQRSDWVGAGEWQECWSVTYKSLQVYDSGVTLAEGVDQLT